MRRRAATVGLLILAAAAVGAFQSPTRAATARPRNFKQWLGGPTLALLRAADRVEPFAIRPWPAKHPPRGHEAEAPPKPLPAGTPPQVAGFPVYAVGPAQSRDFAQRLTTALLDDRSYLHRDINKGCTFAPGVAFRVWAAQRFVDILVCFRCDQVEVSPLAGRRGWNSVASDDIDPGRVAFLKLAQEALGDVSEVRAIPAESR
jgi:hypothetical protein